MSHRRWILAIALVVATGCARLQAMDAAAADEAARSPSEDESILGPQAAAEPEPEPSLAGVEPSPTDDVAGQPGMIDAEVSYTAKPEPEPPPPPKPKKGTKVPSTVKKAEIVAEPSAKK